MATEDTNNIIVNLLNDVVNRLNEVNRREGREIRERWTVENVNKLEKNLQVLNADFSRMKGFLIQFQYRAKTLPEPVKICFQKIEAALRDALNLIDDTNRQQSENRYWKSNFDALLQELENHIIVNVLNEAIARESWTVENVNKLEKNLQVLNADFSRMKGFLIQFQCRAKTLPEPVKICFQKIEAALRDALDLIDDTNRQQSENRYWKSNFDALLQELEKHIIVNVLNEAIARESWTVENVNKLEKNLQVLNADFSKMKGLLIQFQSREKRLPETGERIEGALREALNLIEQQERGWCLPCRNPLSTKNRVWKARFDAVVQELEDTNKIIVKVLNEVNRTEKWPVEKVNKLEINLQVLKIDFSRMKGLLIQISNQFQSRQKKLPEPVESCLERIDGALRQALVLIDEANREQERGWGLSYRNSLSSKNGVWKTRFDGLLQELEFAISISSNTEQIVPRSQRLLQALPDAYFVERAFQSVREQLQKWLEENPRKGRKIGVYGRSGVGKTSLLKIIYNYYKKKVSGFFDIFIWVTVSGSFEIEQLQDSIAEALNLSLEGTSNAESRKTKLNAPLERKRFLLILDNMSNEIDLNEVGISIGDDNGSKILISSRNKEVVEKMGAKDFLLEIKPLTIDEGWELIRGRAFAKGVVPENNIETRAKKIASACGGLPLAINAVAATMSSEKTENDWETALKFMESTDSSFQRSQTNIHAELYQALRWSFKDLSDLHLNCFLNCAAFLGDKEIPVETLLQMWDAEGLLKGAETPYWMDAKRHCIKELVSRCLLECVEYIVDDDYHSVEYLKIHEALRDMAINIGSQRNEKFLFLAGQKLQNFPVEGDTRDCRRISVDHTAIKDLPNDLKSSKLESLVLASNNKLERIPDRFFSNIRSLKILDLSSTSIGTLPDLQQLQQLKFLNLASCTKLVELPGSLCTLSNLQVLNLSSCLALRSLPSQIGELKNLKHLKLDACYGLNGLPENLSQLTSLNTLSLPLMESICAVSVEDLLQLSNLTELTTVVKSENKDTEVAWLEMRNLTLEYDADADAERGCVAPEQKMGHMKELQNFHLINYQGRTLPSSICEFQKMKMLLLHSCYQLKALPALDKNRSDSAADRSDSAGYSFPILEKLVLRNLLKLERLAGSWNERTMSKLQFLVIINCPLLKELPSGMKLPYLKELHITMCNELTELDIGSDGFPMLEMLTLDELNKLERIADPATVWTEGTMSELQILEVIDCPLLTTLPKGMEKLSSLKQINGELDWWQRISWADDKVERILGKLFMII